MNELEARDLAIMRVMKTLARQRAQGDILPVRDSRGVAPIVVTLPEDLVGGVEAKVRAVGGAANVVLAMPDSFAIWTWNQGATASAASVDVHESSTMAMLLLWLERCEGSASINVVSSELSGVREMNYQF
ncbi:hypothetical protein [Microbacterium sp. NPDC057658]|uniref:hypothetical protein n=1 Tax=unclassified Microbacterium TaxID=2609290 RepID=UPI003670D58F